jgi:hypothetical protein
MTGDDPYQAPRSLEGPDENQDLPSKFWTEQKITVLFLAPTVFAIVFRLLAFYLPSLYNFTFFPVVLIFIALGVNCKLTAICTNSVPRAEDTRIALFVTWFIVWGLAQLILFAIALILFSVLIR